MFRSLTKIKINRNFRRNGNFSKILLKSTFLIIFENFDQNRNFFRKFDQKRNISKIWTKSKFFEKFDQNRKFWKILQKSTFLEIFESFEQNRNFSKILLKSTFLKIFIKIKFFFENLTKNVIFRKFEQNRNFLKNLNKKKKIEIFGLDFENRSHGSPSSFGWDVKSRSLLPSTLC